MPPWISIYVTHNQDWFFSLLLHLFTPGNLKMIDVSHTRQICCLNGTDLVTNTLDIFKYCFYSSISKRHKFMDSHSRHLWTAPYL